VAKTRAQRKAERRRREAQSRQEGAGARDTRAQQRTQVPRSADVVEAELAEQGADLDSLRDAEIEDLISAAEQSASVAPPEEELATAIPEPPPEEEPVAPAPSRADVGVPEPADRISRRARREAEKDRKRRAQDFEERRRKASEAQVERQRGAVVGFFVSCWAELKRVQWPDRETLIQASAVTLFFIAVAAAYLGALDAIFNWLVQHIL